MCHVCVCVCLCVFSEATETTLSGSASARRFVWCASLAIAGTLGSRAEHLFDHRVEGAAVTALDPQKVPVSGVAFRFAIVAHNVHYPLQVRGHRVLGNVSGAGLPRSGHRLLRDDRLFANGAAVVETGQFAKAVCVDGVAAGQVLGRLAGGKHVLSADRAVVFVLIFETPVGFENVDRNAHAAFRAVPKVLLTTHSAETTLVAMEWLFGLTHP